MNAKRVGRFAAFALCSSLIVVAISYAGPLRPTPQAEAPDFWAALHAEGTYGTYDSEEAAIKASDLVVIGTVTNVSLSRQVNAIPDWGEDGILTFAAVEVRVERVLASKAPISQDKIAWEAFVPMPGGLEQMQSAVPVGPVLLLLQKNPESKAADSYILLNPESYFVNEGGLVRVAIAASQPWSLGYDGRVFDTLVESVSRLATTGS